jgi:hypothetical protein
MPTQLIDAARKSVVANDQSRPDGVVEFLTEDDVSGPLGQDEKHVHHFGVKLRPTRGAAHFAGWRINREVAELKAVPEHRLGDGHLEVAHLADPRKSISGAYQLFIKKRERQPSSLFRFQEPS